MGNSCHRDFWKIMMDALPNMFPKSIIEVLNRLENDEDNRYSWKLTRNQDSLSLTVSCKLLAKTPNKAKGDSEVAERATVKPVRRRRKKRNSPSAFPGEEVSWKNRFTFARRPAGFCVCKGTGKYQSCLW